MEELTERMECVEVWVCRVNGKRYCCDCGREIAEEDIVGKSGTYRKSINILRGVP
ncbi:hypothetical protein GF336_05710 [Candidatus Woesearchaeota archaeon]|nr:hypothetical protein [Candidatus Woesearchaeota archaeon]